MSSLCFIKLQRGEGRLRQRLRRTEGGTFWLKSELFLTKIRTANSEIQSLGRAKRKGVGGKEFLPALAFRFQFFSAAAEFRASETGAPHRLNFW